MWYGSLCVCVRSHTFTFRYVSRDSVQWRGMALIRRCKQVKFTAMAPSPLHLTLISNPITVPQTEHKTCFSLNTVSFIPQDSKGKDMKRKDCRSQWGVCMYRWYLLTSQTSYTVHPNIIENYRTLIVLFCRWDPRISKNVQIGQAKSWENVYKIMHEISRIFPFDRMA